VGAVVGSPANAQPNIVHLSGPRHGGGLVVPCGGLGRVTGVVGAVPGKGLIGYPNMGWPGQWGARAA